MGQGGKRGGRAATWPWDEAARLRRAVPWLPWRLADVFAPIWAQLRLWAAAEAGSGRLVPWLAVMFGLGIALYFTPAREPSAWAALAAFLAGAVATFAARRRAVAFAVLAAVTALAAGFALATVTSRWAAHPVLQHPLFDAQVTGWVTSREERERTDRIVVAIRDMSARRLAQPLARVRVSVRKGTAPPVGSFVTFKARLSPPLTPLRPGGYDFARDLYFQQIGASGFALGRITPLTGSEPPPPRLRFAARVAELREAIDDRIRAALPGDLGAIASALVTGKRDAITTPVNEAMYVSGLAHVLSISGYHMAVVAGVVFFIVRGLLALSPALALRHPIKKWASAAALLAATGYLILSGAEVATQRAYVMTAIVLIGVLADRAALTLRTLAVAAFGVLLVSPQAVVHPSFQMSFAATLALVAAYERARPWVRTGSDTSFGARVALWGGRELVSLLLASLVAGAATTLFAAYHFHRLAPYGVLANLLAMPIVSVWVMPAGLVALVAMLFGFDDMVWPLMGFGIQWMVTVAQWVADLPGAVGRVKAFGAGPLLVATAGFLMLCLLRTPLRWGGAGVIVAGLLLAAATPRPDVLIASGAEAVAVRKPDGKLAILTTGRDTFAVREWLAADADPRSPDDHGLREGFSCDKSGCAARLADGSVVSVVFRPEAFAEECARAALIVTTRLAPPECRARVVDRTVLSETGALRLQRVAEGWREETSRPRGAQRPWSSAPPHAAESRAGAAASAPAPDSRPDPKDLLPDD